MSGTLEQNNGPEEGGNQPPREFRRILACLESRPEDRAVLDRAIALAARSKGSVEVLDFELYGEERTGAPAGAEREESFRAGIGVPDVPVGWSTRRGQDPNKVIPAEAKKGGHDLVVKASRKEPVRFLETLYDTPDVPLLRNCRSPVWLVGPGAPPRTRRILAAVRADADDPIAIDLDLNVLSFAKAQAAAEEAELWVAHAWRANVEVTMKRALLPDEFQEYLDQARTAAETRARALVTRAGLELPPDRVLVPRGEVGDALARTTEELAADLVVVGTQGRTGARAFLAPNAVDSIVRDAQCSLLVIRPAR